MSHGIRKFHDNSVEKLAVPRSRISRRELIIPVSAPQIQATAVSGRSSGQTLPSISHRRNCKLIIVVSVVLRKTLNKDRRTEEFIWSRGSSVLKYGSEGEDITRMTSSRSVKGHAIGHNT